MTFIPTTFVQTLILRGKITSFMGIASLIFVGFSTVAVAIGAPLALILLPLYWVINVILILIGGIAIARHQSLGVALLLLLEGLANILVGFSIVAIPVYHLVHDTPPMSLPFAVWGFLTGVCQVGIALLAPWPKSRGPFAIMGGLSLLMGLLFLTSSDKMLPFLWAALIQWICGICLFVVGRRFRGVNAVAAQQDSPLMRSDRISSTVT